MSRKNSRENKRLRREANQYRQERFINPCPKPDEYIHHYGYVPDTPFFRNAALAGNRPDMRTALRTKKQLIDYVENNPECRKMSTKVGKETIYVSFVYDAGEEEVERSALGTIAWKPVVKDGFYAHPEEREDKTQLYQVRSCVLKGSLDSQIDWKKDNPFFTAINSFFICLDDLDKLPEKRLTKEELVYFAKQDEYASPLDEDELDVFFSTHKESYLRENYVFNEHGLVIDEIPNKETGEVFYQPKKTRKTWEHCSFNAPLLRSSQGFNIPVKELFDKKKSKERSSI